MLEIAVAVAPRTARTLLPHRAYGSVTAPLPLPACRGDRLESALQTLVATRGNRALSDLSLTGVAAYQER
jgi:hypothetical protein